MKMLACNCLNVLVETESDDFPKVNPDGLHLNEEESEDVFFKQEILHAKNLIKIKKTHASLINTRSVGSWSIYRCMNCDLQTHAVHNEKGAGLVLVNSKLLTGSDITELQKSNLLSNVYNIIIDTSLEDTKGCDYLPTDVELAITGFKQQASEFINREVTATEERVRLFTEHQYAALEECRERAIKEQKALMRAILNSKNASNKTSSTNNMSTTNVAVSKPIATNVPEENAINAKLSVLKPQTKEILNSDSPQTPEKKAYHKLVSQRNSFDSEGLFVLEDMDNLDSYSNLEEEYSDSEEREDGGIQIKQNKATGHQLNLAKSLPMNIPVFFPPFQTHENEEQEDMLHHPEDPMDIAASIKALAKSVHGDTVFGDLPRPRCRTNI